MRKKNIMMLSGKARSGKTTMATLLNKQDSPFEIVSFAKPLKKIAEELFKWNGEKDAEGRILLIMLGQILRDELNEFIEENIGHKEKAIECDKIVREYFSPRKDFWIDLAINKILLSESQNIVIDDWRFRSEYYGLSCLFSNIVKIRLTRSTQDNIQDRSEIDLDGFSFDLIVKNETYEDLNNGIKEAISLF